MRAIGSECLRVIGVVMLFACTSCSDDATAAGDDPMSSGENDGSQTDSTGSNSVPAKTRVCESDERRECVCSTREIGVDYCRADGSGFTNDCVECEPALPATVRVEVLGVALMPGRTPTESWDGTQTPDAEAWELVGVAATGVPGVGSAVKAVTDLTISVTDKPDIAGFVEIWTGDAWDTLEVTKQQDTFITSWTDAVWESVSLSDETSLRLRLFEVDVLNDDEIPAFTVSSAALAEAWVAGGAYWIEGDAILDQTMGGVLGVQVQLLSTK